MLIFNNWICSCPTYLKSRYLICKHLVYKKNGRQFIPTYTETVRRHDYPFLIFENENLPTITPINNPWVRYGMDEELDIHDEEEDSSSQKHLSIPDSMCWSFAYFIIYTYVIR